jgi:hypothetical protein
MRTLDSKADLSNCEHLVLFNLDQTCEFPNATIVHIPETSQVE